MFDFLKSKERKKEDLIHEMISAWHAGCIASVDNKELLKEPRVIAGTVLFFIGSIDNLCRSADFDDKKFGKIVLSVLENIGYPGELPALIFLNFYNPEKKQSAFALNANMAGGKGVGQFVASQNPMACLAFSTLVEEWASNPEMTGEDLSLFGVESDAAEKPEKPTDLILNDEDDLFESENNISEFDERNSQEENLLKKYHTVSFREYDAGPVSRIQDAARKGTVLIFEGSVEDVFSVGDQGYIKIYSFSYNIELCGNLEVNDEQKSFFLNKTRELDSFYFFIMLTKAESVLPGDENSAVDTNKSDSDKKIFIEGTLIVAEKVIEDTVE